MMDSKVFNDKFEKCLWIYEFDVVFGWGEEKEDEKWGKEKGEGKVFFLYLVGVQK